MNERIHALLKESEYYLADFEEYDNDPSLAKFAELLIKETLQVARAGIEFGNGMEDAVYTYFGIEE